MGPPIFALAGVIEAKTAVSISDMTAIWVSFFTLRLSYDSALLGHSFEFVSVQGLGTAN
jgi:hypothetical protein